MNRALEAQTQATRRNHPQRLGRRTPTTPPPSSTPAKPPAPAATNPIHAGEHWHLDHSDTRGGYLGVSHATCNLRDGANKTNARRPRDAYVEHPYRWSRRFYDDPPIGTIVYGDERVIYMGNGDRQPL